MVKIIGEIEQIWKFIENPLKEIGSYIKPIKMDGEWLGIGWGIRLLCVQILCTKIFVPARNHTFCGLYNTWEMKLCLGN